MIKHYYMVWYESERKLMLDMIAGMSKDLKEYAATAKANTYAVKKREESIRAIAKFIDATTQYMGFFVAKFDEESQEQFRRGMVYQKKLDTGSLDKYGVDKEWVRIQSINRHKSLDNV